MRARISEAIVLGAVAPCGQPPGATRMARSTSISTMRLKMCAHVHVLLHLLLYECTRVLLLFKIDCTLKLHMQVVVKSIVPTPSVYRVCTAQSTPYAYRTEVCI